MCGDGYKRLHTCNNILFWIFSSYFISSLLLNWISFSRWKRKLHYVDNIFFSKKNNKFITQCCWLEYNHLFLIFTLGWRLKLLSFILGDWNFTNFQICKRLKAPSSISSIVGALTGVSAAYHYPTHHSNIFFLAFLSSQRSDMSM